MENKMNDLKDINVSSEKQESNFIVTDKAVFPEGETDRCFCCNQEIGREHDVNCETIRKVLGINLLDWFQISVPNFFTEDDIQNKVESISEAVYSFLHQHLAEHEGKNFLDAGSDIGDCEQPTSPYLDEYV